MMVTVLPVPPKKTVALASAWKLAIFAPAKKLMVAPIST